MPYVPVRAAVEPAASTSDEPAQGLQGLTIAGPQGWRTLLLPRRSTTAAAWVLSFAPIGTVAVLALAWTTTLLVPRLPLGGFAVLAIAVLATLLLAASDQRRMAEFGWDFAMPFPAMLGTPLLYLGVRQYRIARAGGSYLPLLLTTAGNLGLVAVVAWGVWLSNADWLVAQWHRVFGG